MITLIVLFTFLALNYLLSMVVVAIVYVEAFRDPNIEADFWNLAIAFTVFLFAPVFLCWSALGKDG